jgi:hypothetical protein
MLLIGAAVSGKTAMSAVKKIALGFALIST